MQTTNNAANENTPVVLVREGSDARYNWKQYLVIRDRWVAVVEMSPALCGWNLGRVKVQGSNDWDMDRDAIVAWKMRHDDRAAIADINPAFRDRLLAHAGANR